jgi:site-specific DNA-adenine methylase
MVEFGIPYQGSKSSIARRIIDIFPSCDNFYDLFGGGFSITHAMLLYRNKNFKNFYFNEPRQGICELIKNAIAGKYNYKVFKPEFIDRETFLKLKEIDPYIKICWSFGNNGRSYLFGKDIESHKKSLHNAVVFDKYDDYYLQFFKGVEIPNKLRHIKDRRLWVRNQVPKVINTKDPRQLQQLEQLQQIERLEQLERLQQLERLEQIEQIEQIEQLHFSTEDYKNIIIKNNSVIYCDIPYEGTGGYGTSFNHNEFYKWVKEQENPVFVSEYARLENRGLFLCRSIDKISLFISIGNRNIKNELIYCNEIARGLLKKTHPHLTY